VANLLRRDERPDLGRRCAGPSDSSQLQRSRPRALPSLLPHPMAVLPLRTLDAPFSTNPVPRPPEFDTMRVMAESLADDRDFIRVNFLVNDGRV
jgi:hypothetical protein